MINKTDSLAIQGILGDNAIDIIGQSFRYAEDLRKMIELNEELSASLNEILNLHHKSLPSSIKF